jgi:hypothetical protein
MVDALLEILDGFGYPVYRQGSLGKKEPYPESFFTYWVTDSPEHAHYDNRNYGIAWACRVYFYSTNPALTYDKIAEARATLKEAGWVVPSAGYDVPSDEETHTGRAIDIYYLDV